MIKTPLFLQKLMQSNAYTNNNNPDYIRTNNKVTNYLQKLYPGKLEYDETGRLSEPEYDMTRQQFEEAQKQIDEDFEDEKSDAENEAENSGLFIDIDDYVFVSEQISVRVLESNGNIGNDYLLVYALNAIDSENPKSNKVWVWHSEISETSCKECAELDGKVFYKENEIPECPVHPNCKCWVEEIDKNNNKNTKYKGSLMKDKIKNYTFSQPIDTNKGQFAIFNGKNLSIYQNDKKIASWGGVSGRKNLQNPEYQNLKSKGPIPEGVYIGRKTDYQERKDSGFFRRYYNWQGGENSWGKSRLWLEPALETNTYGRNGFSIHGGKDPGSAGCIDLTSQMKNFSKWFKNNGKDLIIIVKY